LLLRPETVGGLRAAAKVVECCEKALALKPGYAEAYIVMSQELRLMRRYKEAGGRPGKRNCPAARLG
jgi:hypothetical protein